MERKIYLSNTDIEEAIATYLDRLDKAKESIGIEYIDIRDALGRITAEPVFARISAPNHNAAAMDGIMVIAERTYKASEANPIVLTKGKDFEYINTGHLITEPYDSVIMIEDVIELDADKVRITVQASPWQHIRPIGEDIVAGEMVLPENHKIRPIDIGAVLNSGVTDIKVYERVRVGIMPTGNEITDTYGSLEKGKTFDTNSYTFKGIIEEWGGMPERLPPVPDDYGMLFVFDRVDYHSFWMKNTYLPLDLVWIGPDRRIVEIQQGVPPCKTSQCPSYFPKVPALYVLELPSGKASFYRLKAGDPLGFLLP